MSASAALPASAVPAAALTVAEQVAELEAQRKLLMKEREEYPKKMNAAGASEAQKDRYAMLISGIDQRIVSIEATTRASQQQPPATAVGAAATAAPPPETAQQSAEDAEAGCFPRDALPLAVCTTRDQLAFAVFIAANVLVAVCAGVFVPSWGVHGNAAWEGAKVLVAVFSRQFSLHARRIVATPLTSWRDEWSCWPARTKCCALAAIAALVTAALVVLRVAATLVAPWPAAPDNATATP